MRILRLIVIFLAVALPAFAQTATPAERELARSILKQLVEINTTDSVGNVSTAARAMQKRFLDAGFPAADLQVIGPDARKLNLLVRYRGTSGASPVLLLCHLDVVEAVRSDWHTDPFVFTEKDGYWYGRGTLDMKGNDAIAVTDLIRLYRAGYKPTRDIYLALTADEEGGKFNGVNWLLKNRPELQHAAFVINPDAGGITLENGKATAIQVEATEKIYSDFELTTVNRGGHSSLPRPDNAIYELTAALDKLAHYQFPFELNNVTRQSFAAYARTAEPEVASDILAILAPTPAPAAIERLDKNPDYNSNLHTTCVATRLSAGHANNALPQRAQAIVNCRILPGHAPEEVRRQLLALFNNPGLAIRYISDSGEGFDVAPDRKSIAPPPPIPEVFDPLTAIAGNIWPGAPVVPVMENGASDSIYAAMYGIPSYGFSAIAITAEDERAHGQDERMPIDSYWKGLDFYYDFLKAIGTPKK
jgi:acetylornithine deacetylase/succinyl-diaminopimelate desuccinylase-like protein